MHTGETANHYNADRDLEDAQESAPLASSATAEQRYQALISASISIVWRASPAGAVLEAWGWDQLSGQTRQAYQGAGWLNALHPDDRQHALGRWRKALSTAVLDVIEYRVQQPSGEYRWVQVRGVALRDARGAITEWIGTVTDIQEEKGRTTELREQSELLRLAVEATNLGIWEMELPSHRTIWSPQLKTLAGLSPDTDIDDDFFYNLVHPDDRARVESALIEVVSSQNAKPYEIVYRILRGDTAECRWWHEWTKLTFHSDGRPSRLVGAIRDVTDQKEAEKELEHAASHDFLTGILNRSSLQAHLEALTDETDPVSLLVVDIDKFKETNDILGHDAGDCLLQTAAKYLEVAVGQRGMVARLGGDEFAVLIPISGDPEQLADTILNELRKGFLYGGFVRPIRGSVGVTTYPGASADPSQLLKDADLALYVAKAAGGARSILFSRRMRANLEDRFLLLSDIRTALEASQFEPFYQPKVDLISGAVVGFEALARWVHPTRGILAPSEFSAAFEDAELSRAISEIMSSKVVADMTRWREAGHNHCVSINLSPFDFAFPDFSDRFLDMLRGAQIPTSLLTLEITETVLLDSNSGDVEAILIKLHDAGLAISLDDFGTGYASLIHLKRFPVDELKIDKTFVGSVEANAEDKAIVSAIIELARTMGFKIVVEGVETKGQAAILADMGCGVAQGYLFSAPLPFAGVEDFLAR